jgi:hypothetical protein
MYVASAALNIKSAVTPIQEAFSAFTMSKSSSKAFPARLFGV